MRVPCPKCGVPNEPVEEGARWLGRRRFIAVNIYECPQCGALYERTKSGSVVMTGGPKDLVDDTDDMLAWRMEK